MPEPAIRAEGLVKDFGATRALDGLDLEVKEGAVMGLLGPNGAGKTTAIRILTTLLRPDEGRARVAGFDVVEQPEAVRAQIGLTGQYAAVDELLSGSENLYMIGRLLGMSKDRALARAAELLGSFDLSEAADKIVKTFSGGMRRRLDLAASLVGRPRLLFLDEPTTGLDPRSRRQLWALIRGLVSDGTTVLLTTQYLDEADQLADTIVVIDHGRVIAAGTSDELKSKVGGQVVQVRPVDALDLDRTVSVLFALTGGETTVDRDAGVVTAPIGDAGLLAAAVRRLDEASIEVADLALRKPSLDDVFLALTGHVAEAEPIEDTETEGSYQ